MEVGKQNVTLNTIIKISKALDVNLTTLFFRENNTYYRNYIEDNYIEVFSENVKKEFIKEKKIFMFFIYWYRNRFSNFK